jgi:hypothetical protein
MTRSKSSSRPTTRPTARPVDQLLYDAVKQTIYKNQPVHSAYRSGAVVKEYKKRFAAKHGVSRSAYRGIRSKTTGLKRWFREKWRNQRGEIGYRYKSDVYRPTRRITKKTPRTFRELGKHRIRRGRTKKYRRGRVDTF